MRKRTSRKRYRADPGAWLRALGMQQALDDSQQTDLALPVRMAALAMRSGAAVEHHVHTLASCANVCLVLAERGAGAEYTGDVIEAQLALVRTIERGKRAGRWGFDGPAIAAVERMLAIWDQQLQAVPRDALRQAVREVHSRMDRKLVFEVARA